MNNNSSRSLAYALFTAVTILVAACSSEKHPMENSALQPGWFDGMTLYEVYLRAYSPAGTINALTADLDRLQQLGAGALWLMPIHPVGVEGRKGGAGSPYSVRDYFSVGGEYGTLDDLKRLVAEAHKRDMKVILDMVINHSANDHILMSEHPDWWMHDSTGAFTREVADWADVTDWNLDNEGARNYLISVLLYWIKAADVDGYRCDVAGMVPPDFWSDAVRVIHEHKPDAFMLAEWEDPWILDSGFDATYDWNLYHRMVDYASGEITLEDLWKAVEQKQEIYPTGKLPLRFIENHDEMRAAKVFGWPESRAYAALIFTLPGIPLLYTGQEAGEVNKPSLFEAQPVIWDEGNRQVPAFYLQLANMRRIYPALQRGTMVRMPANDSNVLMFARLLDDKRMLVIINFGDDEVTVPRPGEIGPGEYQEVADQSGFVEETTVGAHDYRVFKLK